MSRDVDKIHIYLDYAASTPIDGRIRRKMAEVEALYGNPSSFNEFGRTARQELQKSRLTIARFLGAKVDEVIFTASGSEANNLAIFGLANRIEPGEIITTPIEHLSILKPLEVLKNRGWNIIFLKIDSEGLVNPEDLRQKLNPRVKLVSVMYANNEVGTIQPIIKISKIIRGFKIKNLKFKIDEKIYPFFHVDACQAAEYLNMNVNNLGVDLLTFNGAKIYGPKGIAVLYKKRGVNLSPLIYGGDQEYGLRAGTENLPAIVGLAEAISIIKPSEAKRVAKLRDYFLKQLKDTFPDVILNGPMGDLRLPGNINISFKNTSAEQLLLELDKYGIYASSGSACTAHSVEPSHVLKAIGTGNDYISGTLRFSLGRRTTRKNIDYVLRVLPATIKNVKNRYRN